MLKINKTCAFLITICFLAGCEKTKKSEKEIQPETQITEEEIQPESQPPEEEIQPESQTQKKAILLETQLNEEEAQIINSARAKEERLKAEFKKKIQNQK